jgi:hypothetical protein
MSGFKQANPDYAGLTIIIGGIVVGHTGAFGGIGQVPGRHRRKGEPPRALQRAVNPKHQYQKNKPTILSKNSI